MARGAKRARALAVCAAGALAVSLGMLAPAGAQTGARTAAQAERERRAEASRAELLNRQAEEARNEIHALDRRMVEAGRRRAEAEAAAAAAEQRLGFIQRQIADSSAERTQLRLALDAALITAAFAGRRLEPSAVRAGIFARGAATGFASQESISASALAAAQEREQVVREEQRIIAEAHAAIDAERAELVTLTARRRAAQAQLANDAAAASRRARALATEARNLRELTQRASAASRSRDRTAPRGNGSSVPVSWRAPVRGSIIRAFGARDGEGLASQGVLLRTPSGVQVIAPASAEITFAGVFRSYGRVLILDIDEGYALVLTGLENTLVSVGDRVRAGQPVGEMTESDTAAPELYVEVRHNGRPVDPGRWLSAQTAGAEQGAGAGSGR